MEPLISVRNLRKEFPAKEGKGTVVAVDDVNLRVEKGEVIALLGPSGSGKTTLLAMTGGQFAPDQGDILIDGRSIIGLRRAAKRPRKRKSRPSSTS